ncbi:hypothetical protein, partial [Heyndrickxia acidiproducens]
EAKNKFNQQMASSFRTPLLCLFLIRHEPVPIHCRKTCKKMEVASLFVVPGKSPEQLFQRLKTRKLLFNK